MKKLMLVLYFLFSLGSFAQVDFIVQLKFITDSSIISFNNGIIEFGLDSSATDSIDQHLGEFEFPPDFCLCYCMCIGFELPLSNFALVNRDFRYGVLPYNIQSIHYLKFYTPGNELAISWGFPNGVTGTLQDEISGTIINVNMSDSGFYQMPGNLVGIVNKLKMIINYNNVTPVELITFTSSVVDNDVTISWTTTTETNNQGFEVQRSLTPTPSQREGALDNWRTFGFVNGNGTTTEPQTYSIIDENLSAGKYQYRLKQIDFDGTFEYSNTIEAEINSPTKFSLEQNYPNPFNPGTKINFTIPTSTLNLSSYQGEGNRERFVSLKVYDVLGNEIATLVNEEKPAGSYDVDFDASNLASGIYYFQLKAGVFIETKKMILLR